MFYAKAVETKNIVALSTLAFAQENRMEEMADEMVKLLNYRATHLDAIVKFKFCVFRNLYGLIKTEVYLNFALRSILYR